MQIYLDLMRKIRDTGEDELNTRTGQMCRFIIGEQLKFDLREGFPALTTKRLAFTAMRGELLGFFRGYDNAAQFRELGCNIWNANANETPAWLANPARRGTDDLGAIYGVNWTAWSDKRLVSSDCRSDMEVRGFKYIGKVVNEDRPVGPKEPSILMERKINQLENALAAIITNPTDRRIIVSGWNPAAADISALMACHMDYRFVPVPSRNVLNVVMTIRSWDYFLGAGFNIASTALFLEIMARLSGYQAGEVCIQATNVHLYENHMSQVDIQLSRTPYELPSLVLSDRIKRVALFEVQGAFKRINVDDIHLKNYKCHPAIPAPMAA